MQAPVDVTVLRSGIPDTVPGRALNVCERGIAAVLAGEMNPGESVGVELRLSSATETLRTRAKVRYQDKLLCGLEFVALSVEQRNAIRDWTKGGKAEVKLAGTSVPLFHLKDPKKNEVKAARSPALGVRGPRKRMKYRRWVGAIFACVLLGLLAAGFRWQWDRTWAELESSTKTSQVDAEKPQAQVPAAVMQSLLVHRIEPVYPAEARKQRLQGVIAVNIVVGRDGSVLSMRALNGPELLAKAAMDALRWWKFEPYRLNGDPAVVETTLAIEFKR
jgi:TonB family C-terminal domain